MAEIIELDKEQNEWKRRMDRIALIIQWSAKMCAEGHMPPEVAKAFSEYFGDAEDYQDDDECDDESEE